MRKAIKEGLGSVIYFAGDNWGQKYFDTVCAERGLSSPQKYSLDYGVYHIRG